jgi:hypothetical protein
MSFRQRMKRWPQALDEEGSHPLIKKALEMGIDEWRTESDWPPLTDAVPPILSAQYRRG